MHKLNEHFSNDQHFSSFNANWNTSLSPEYITDFLRLQHLSVFWVFHSNNIVNT